MRKHVIWQQRWELPACVKCAGCGNPLVLAWTSSCVGHEIYHSNCYHEMKGEN